MSSATYELFRKAMAECRQIVCMYGGFRREICPIILGHSDGVEKALTYQFGGRSSRPLTNPANRWRCLTLSAVTDVELRDGDWHSGGGHSTAQTCVKVVDYDVNPESPYDPRGTL
jgi:hypothetical protein